MSIVSSEVTPRREILRLGLPMVIGALSSTAAGAIDIAMMGHYGSADLAAVAGAAALFDIFGGIVLASATGHQILAARFAGREDPSGIRRSLLSSIVFCGPIALALMLTCMVAGGPLTALMVGGDQTLSSTGGQYLAARAPAMLMVLAFSLLAAMFNAYKRPRYAMVAGLVINGVNILLDVLLIYGPGPAPRLGAAGNGLATSISWFVGVGVLLVAARRFGLIELLRRPASQAPIDFVTSVPRLGWPAMVSTGLDYLSVALFFAVVGTLSEAALGGGRIAFELMILVFGVASAFAAAARILIGRSVGAQQYSKARAYWRAGRLTLLTPLLAIAVVVAVFPRAVAGVFTGFSPVVDAAAQALLLVALSLPLMAWTMGNVSQLRALGHTDRDMYANLIAALGIQLPLGWALAGPAGLGLTGAFLGVLGYWAARAVVTEILARRAMPQIAVTAKEGALA